MPLQSSEWPAFYRRSEEPSPSGGLWSDYRFLLGQLLGHVMAQWLLIQTKMCVGHICRLQLSELVLKLLFS
jgi:hypothetical protein